MRRGAPGSWPPAGTAALPPLPTLPLAGAALPGRRPRTADAVLALPRGRQVKQQLVQQAALVGSALAAPAGGREGACGWVW